MSAQGSALRAGGTCTSSGFRRPKPPQTETNEDRMCRCVGATGYALTRQPAATGLLPAAPGPGQRQHQCQHPPFQSRAAAGPPTPGWRLVSRTAARAGAPQSSLLPRAAPGPGSGGGPPGCWRRPAGNKTGQTQSCRAHASKRQLLDARPARQPAHMRAHRGVSRGAGSGRSPAAQARGGIAGVVTVVVQQQQPPTKNPKNKNPPAGASGRRATARCRLFCAPPRPEGGNQGVAGQAEDQQTAQPSSTAGCARRSGA